MSRVVVNEQVLRWAVKRSRLEREYIEHRFPKIKQWVTGEVNPTLRQLESLAKATLTPLGFFFLEKPPEQPMPIPHYRTFGDEGPTEPSPYLLETIQIMQRRQAWMREYLIDQGQDKLSYVNSVNRNDDPVSIANHIRSALGLDDGWAAEQHTWTDALRFLRESMEDSGILVVVNSIIENNTHLKLDPREFRGFVLVDEYAPLVFINGADFKAPQMFTLAHELAHIFFGSSAAFDLREMKPADEPIELASNRVAAEFLVPKEDLLRFWKSVRNDSNRFQKIARRFKISEVVAARRALDLDLIKLKSFLEFYNIYQNRELHTTRPEGGDFYANQNLRVGQRFASTIIRAVKEGKLLYSEAYRLTGLYGKTFAHYAASLGFGGE